MYIIKNVLHNTVMPHTTPTLTTYAELQQAYDSFNQNLFDGKLPDCMLTLQREKRTYGYFSADRFGDVNGCKAIMRLH